MDDIYGSVISFFLQFGGLGLFLIAVADSSFLLLPIANDLILVLLVSRRPVLIVYYAGMAAIGSVLGFFLLDLVFRKGGQATIEKHVPRKRLEHLQSKVERRTGLALAIGCLIPPPFPMKPLLASASLLQYPRKKLLTITGVARFARFMVDGIIAILLGDKIVGIIKSPIVQDLVYALIAVAVLGSAGSIYLWIKRSRRAAGGDQTGQSPA